MDNRNNDLSGLGDFTAGPRVVTIGAMAVGIGIVGAYVALGLLKLIGLFTNLFFFQRWSTAFASPADHALGAFVILVPVVGALIIGFMARLYPVVDESQRLVGVVTRVDPATTRR